MRRTVTYSVVVPVYNVAPYLTACLDSLAAAARRVRDAVEVLCIDDGSTDGSGRILDDYAGSVKASSPASGFGLRVVHQANAGVAAARNRGLEAASGEWLMFVDADDLVRETIFADLNERRARHPDAELVGFGLSAFTSGEVRPPWRPAGEDAGGEGVMELKEEVPDLLALTSAYRFAYRADRFGDIRFPPYARGEDLVYVARVIARAHSCVYFEREEYGYRNRPSSAVHAEPTAAAARETVAFHLEMFRTLAASGKELSGELWQLRVKQWILRLPIALSGHGRDPVWRRAWDEWRASLVPALDFPFVSGDCRRVASFALRCPFRPLVALACRLAVRKQRRRRLGVV